MHGAGPDKLKSSLMYYYTVRFLTLEEQRRFMELVDAFNKGEITSLAAIRCLDEGINIPSIKSALILSSNDDYREFVQRRGRILRQYQDKKDAHIYDVIVLPSTNTPGMAVIELRRYLEYAHLAINKNEKLLELDHLMAHYGLTYEQIASAKTTKAAFGGDPTDAGKDASYSLMKLMELQSVVRSTPRQERSCKRS